MTEELKGVVNKIIGLSTRREWAALRQAAKRQGSIRDISDVEDEPDADSRKIEDILLKLPYDEILEIEALMLLGRGDYDDYEGALKDVKADFGKERSESKGMASYYIMSKSPLHEYLSKGVEKMNRPTSTKEPECWYESYDDEDEWL